MKRRVSERRRLSRLTDSPQKHTAGETSLPASRPPAIIKRQEVRGVRVGPVQLQHVPGALEPQRSEVATGLSYSSSVGEVELRRGSNKSGYV